MGSALLGLGIQGGSAAPLLCVAQMGTFFLLPTSLLCSQLMRLRKEGMNMRFSLEKGFLFTLCVLGVRPFAFFFFFLILYVIFTFAFVLANLCAL